MHKTLKFLLSVFFAFTLCGRGAFAVDTNSYRLSFLGGGTLKDIFDAGLRPVRDRTTGYYGEVEEKIVILKVPGGNDFELFADRCRFRVGEGGLLSELSVFSPNLTVDETLLQMKPLVRAFGAQESSLQLFLEKVRRGHSRFGGVNDGIEGYGVSTPRPRSRSGEVWMAARLDWTGNATRPIQIAVTLNWERPIQELRSPSAPIQPPLGYEQFSMEPWPYVVEWIRKGEAPPPDVERRFGKEGIQRLRDEYAAKRGTTNAPYQSQPPPSPVSSSPPIEESPQEVPASTSWPKWPFIAVPLAVFFALGLWWRMRRKN